MILSDAARSTIPQGLSRSRANKEALSRSRLNRVKDNELRPKEEELRVEAAALNYLRAKDSSRLRLKSLSRLRLKSLSRLRLNRRGSSHDLTKPLRRYAQGDWGLSRHALKSAI